MDASGIRLAALYSLGCPELREMNAELRVQSFVIGASQEKPAAIRSILEKIDPFWFYQLIVLSKFKELSDFFGEKAVRAFWIGNPYLKPIKVPDIQRVFANGKLKHKFDVHKMGVVIAKMRGLLGVRPSHNFCVMEILTGIRKGVPIPQEILQGTNECLVRAGKVIAAGDDKINVETTVLVQEELTSFGFRTVQEEVERGFIIGELTPGTLISVHLGKGREVLSREDDFNIREFLREALAFAQRGR